MEKSAQTLTLEVISEGQHATGQLSVQIESLMALLQAL